ncbi:MAG: HAMP domain-containing histidine kinase [Sandaracinus sp.]|nr:HAMP domain-containing histidine kinase [Myxococcales bacterium]MCB9603100.1 HAMP domain-containing histidine kinase [Sandaracinus sp.]MCB9613329.1 HAMP domain-containing histidine kinase [Sandaracinus sp.]MCB9632184.1 HAMP domain-containing histidine kinase [Sandaracinus sp.]
MKSRALGVWTVAVAVPALALAIGWAAASVRDRSSRLALEDARASRVLATAEEAVNVGLDGLRAREDERPFDHYNHYFSPPDVLAIHDPVALSPLASAPRDPRVVGWLQLEPDGTLRTPLSLEPLAETTNDPVRARLFAVARDTALDELRALVAQSEMDLVARVPEVEDAQVPSQVTVNLASFDNRLADEIRLAQSGDVGAITRVGNRGRAPVTRREVVDLGAIRTQQVQFRGSRANAPNPPNPTTEARPVAPVEIDVQYTPMVWRAIEGGWVLTRVVSHEGAAVAQVVVLDATAVRAWVDETLARLGEASGVGVVRGGEDCLRTAPVAPLEGERLCIPRAAYDATRASLDRELAVELGGLGLLASLVILAAFAARRASRREAELARQRSDFVSAVSHELRTPLTTLRMHAEMLAEGLVPEERVPRVYDELSRESQRLSRLVENVLEVSRLEAGRRPLVRERVDLRAQVAELAERSRPLAETRGFTLQITPEGEPIFAEVDPDALERIVLNLIDNASKYGGAASKLVEVSVVASAEGPTLVVADRGPGIAEAQRERVFERFHRAPRPEASHEVGTGLGLALVRELARAHGGEARACGRAGGGAEVRVTFPAARRA